MSAQKSLVLQRRVRRGRRDPSTVTANEVVVAVGVEEMSHSCVFVNALEIGDGLIERRIFLPSADQMIQVRVQSMCGIEFRSACERFDDDGINTPNLSSGAFPNGNVDRFENRSKCIYHAHGAFNHIRGVGERSLRLRCRCGYSKGFRRKIPASFDDLLRPNADDHLSGTFN